MMSYDPILLSFPVYVHWIESFHCIFIFIIYFSIGYAIGITEIMLGILLNNVEYYAHHQNKHHSEKTLSP